VPRSQEEYTEAPEVEPKETLAQKIDPFPSSRGSLRTWSLRCKSLCCTDKLENPGPYS
jgi:hypothetical protein